MVCVIDVLNERKQMPNWCYNKLYVSGPGLDIVSFKDVVKNALQDKIETEGNSDSDTFTFNVADKFPADLKRESETESWRLCHWGTKWDACGTRNDEVKEVISGLELPWIGKDASSLTYAFETAWNPPVIVLHKLSKMFPDLNFSISYSLEEDGWKEDYYVQGDRNLYDELFAAHCMSIHGQRTYQDFMESLWGKPQ